VLENDENDRDDHDQIGVLSTVCGYMSDDGFTIVRRKYKKKVSQDKQKSNDHRANRLSNGNGKESAKANEGNDQKRSRK
jgi:hypothetical protein